MSALRCYDNGGKTADRYTIIPPRWAREYADAFKIPGARNWDAIGCNAEPYHPQGVGMHCRAQPGPHLGKRIAWEDLPADVQRFARQAFPDYAPIGDGVAGMLVQRDGDDHALRWCFDVDAEWQRAQRDARKRGATVTELQHYASRPAGEMVHDAAEFRRWLTFAYVTE